MAIITETSNTQTRDDMLQRAYQEWQRHPITQMFLGHLKKHRHNFSEDMVRKCNDFSVNDNHFRQMSVNMKNTDTIAAMVSQWEVFQKLID